MIARLHTIAQRIKASPCSIIQACSCVRPIKYIAKVTSIANSRARSGCGNGNASVRWRVKQRTSNNIYSCGEKIIQHNKYSRTTIATKVNDSIIIQNFTQDKKNFKLGGNVAHY